MNNNHGFSPNDMRQSNKISLDTFVFDMANIFDGTSDRTIAELKADLSTAWKYHENPPKQIFEPDENLTDDMLLELEKYNYLRDIMYLEDELYALYEMKIAYAFKHLENNIKRLLAAAFEITSTRDFYKWEIMMAFIKSKDILYDSLPSYRDVTHLRQVNNWLKHGGDLSKSIMEFKDKDKRSYLDLEVFYKRVEHAPLNFLSSLASAIYDELYEFGDEKIAKIAESFVLRMDESLAKKFSAALLTMYR